jgi:murein DD-endopeptidase MepM/ murein hydrolase activator NlpD
VPLPLDVAHSPFDRELASIQSDLVGADKLMRLAPSVPLGQPVDGALEVTSPFGGRPDPFTGRLAVHTGLDLREDYGHPIVATAAGKVVAAGPAGGYGNMVEIDHGNGLITRYGHLSAILVAEDQWVDAGAPIGRAGSTGRSTGTHLHYEVRVDGEPVDPMRFLRAGARLYAAN